MRQLRSVSFTLRGARRLALCTLSSALLTQRVDPRMVFLEVELAPLQLTLTPQNALDSKLNPLVLLGKVGVIPGVVNKFNGEAELLDDMNDHWCASKHKVRAPLRPCDR